MKNSSKITSTILLIILLFTLFSGCAKNKAKNALYETTENISTLDPQLAQNDIDLIIADNIYEGLFAIDRNGNTVNAIAESYNVNKNGNVYTFALRNECYWTDNTQVTAYDFEYALKRAVNPKIAAPYSFLLADIKNADKILKGKMHYSALGVTALDNLHLKIELNDKNTNFLKILAMPIAKPCKEEFLINTKGYYGLKPDTVLSNGKFKLYTWNSEVCNFVKNELYSGENKCINDNLYIYFNTEQELQENITKGETDFSVLTQEFVSKLIADGNKPSLDFIGDTVNVLAVNPKSVANNNNIRKALFSQISYTINKEYIKNYGVNNFSSYIPSMLKASNTVKNKYNKYNKSSQNLFYKGCEELETSLAFPTLTVIYIESEVTKSVCNSIAANWQNKFGVTVNITPVNNVDELLNQKDNFDFAILPISANCNFAESYINQFCNNKLLSDCKIDVKELNKIVEKIYKDEYTSEQALNKANKILEKNNYMLPLFEESKIYYYGKNFEEKINKNNKLISF